MPIGGQRAQVPAKPSPLRCPAQGDFSSNPAINQTIEWLREHGYPSLPIAPWHDPKRYPKPNPNRKPGQHPEPLFSGKNPSWLDWTGCPRMLDHKPYHADRLPCVEELKRWFAHPDTGVATLGGWQDTYWLDIDAHHYESPCICQALVQAYLEFAGLQDTFIEQTQSGGARIGVRVESPPNFGVIAFAPGGRQIGEVLGRGKITVLAPTQGIKGQYRSMARSRPAYVPKLADISIYSHRSRLPIQSECRQFAHNTGSSSYPRLMCQRVRDLLVNGGGVEVGQRSDALATITREVYGWQNYAAKRGVALTHADSYLVGIGAQLGLDEARILRILNSCSYGIPIRDSLPAVHYYGGVSACDQILRRVGFA